MDLNKKFVAITGALLFANMPALAQTEAASSAAVNPGVAASSFQSPVAHGARWGTAGIGLYGQTCDNCNEDDADGSLGVAFGLGDPDKYVGLEVAVVASSLFGDTGGDDSFGESGAVSLKLHTNLPGYAAFAVGVNGTGRWGDAEDVNQSSVYAVGSKMFEVGNYAAVLNLGIGDGIYNEPNDTGASIFGSGAFYFTQQVSVVAEYTGRFTNAVVSVAPFKSFPLTISAGATNLGERYDIDTEFAATVGYGFSFY